MNEFVRKNGSKSKNNAAITVLKLELSGANLTYSNY